MNEPNDLFLSYARADDEAFVKKLYASLTAAGKSVWWDRQRMPNRGLTFLQEIRDAVNRSDRLLLVLGPGALKSDYVRAEWEYALSICKPVLAVLRLGGYDLLPDALRQQDAPDFREDAHYADRLAYLLRQLQDEPAPLGALYGVPSLPQWYIKRDAYLNTVIKDVCADTRQPVVITSKQQLTAMYGLGGIGKTTLANALSRDCAVRRTFPDGVFWLELGPSPDVTTRLGDIGAALGDERSEYLDEARARSRLSARLADKQMLLILDDVWDHRHAEAFSVAGNRCRLLLTTRQLQIATKLGGVKREVETLTEDEGLKLIAERLGRGMDGPRPHETSERAIIRTLGGHTLAVSLAAALLYERGADYAPTLLERLDSKGVFHDLKLDEKDKNYNLERSLALSYADLSSDHQRHFRLLGVFAAEGTFSARAAAAVWQEADAEDGLTTLARAGLLRREAGERYSQHTLLRAYARALLSADSDSPSLYMERAASDSSERGGEVSAHQSHYDHYLALAQQHNARQDYLGLDPETANLEAAFEWALAAGQPEAAYWLYHPCREFFVNRGKYEQGKNWLERAAAALADNPDAALQASIQNDVGILYRGYPLGNRRDNLARAVAAHQAALMYRTPEAAPLEYAGTQHNLGNAYRELAQISEREANLTKAVAAYEAALVYRTPDVMPLEYAATQHNLGNAYRDLAQMGEREANLNKAVAAYEAALAYRAAEAAPLDHAATQNNLGIAYTDLSEISNPETNLTRAIAAFEAALVYWTVETAPLSFATTQNNLGNAYCDLAQISEREANFKRGAAAYEAAMLYWTAQAAPLDYGLAQNNLGTVYRALAQSSEREFHLQKALAHFAEALLYRTPEAAPLDHAMSQRNYGNALRDMGDMPGAIARWREAEKYWRLMGQANWADWMLGEIAEAEKAPPGDNP